VSNKVLIKLFRSDDMSNFWIIKYMDWAFLIAAGVFFAYLAFYDVLKKKLKNIFFRIFR